MTSLYYDRQGQPIEMLDWASKHEDNDYKVIAQHWVRGWMVSTVWLGIDHSLNPFRNGWPSPPVIFETMIFPPGDEADGDSVWSGEYQERYSTEAAAQAGHDRALSWLREKLGDDITADICGPLVAGSSDSEWDGSIEGEQ